MSKSLKKYKLHSKVLCKLIFCTINGKYLLSLKLKENHSMYILPVK